MQLKSFAYALSHQTLTLSLYLSSFSFCLSSVHLRAPRAYILHAYSQHTSEQRNRRSHTFINSKTFCKCFFRQRWRYIAFVAVVVAIVLIIFVLKFVRRIDRTHSPLLHTTLVHSQFADLSQLIFFISFQQQPR